MGALFIHKPKYTCKQPRTCCYATEAVILWLPKITISKEIQQGKRNHSVTRLSLVSLQHHGWHGYLLFYRLQGAEPRS